MADERKQPKQKVLKQKAASSSVPIRYSYSGADCKAVAYFQDGTDYASAESPIPLEGLATISYSIYEAKSPVRRLGERSVSGYTKGIRTVAGSMIFLVIEDHPLAKLITKTNKTNVFSKDNEEKGMSYKEIDGVNRYVSTMLKPFNIGLFYKTEVGFTDQSKEYQYQTAFRTSFSEMAHLVISGVEIVSEGMVTSVNDMVTEITMQFVAHDVFNLEKQEAGDSVYKTAAKTKETVREEKSKSESRRTAPKQTQPVVREKAGIPTQTVASKEDREEVVISSTSTEEERSADPSALNFMGPPRRTDSPNEARTYSSEYIPFLDYNPLPWFRRGK